MDNIIKNIITHRIEEYTKILVEEAKQKLADKLPEILAEVSVEILEHEEAHKLGRIITFNINKC